MTNLKAKDIMTRPVISARKNTPARWIAYHLLFGVFSGMPITDETATVIGIITELDLLKLIREGKDLEKLTAGDIMIRNPITVDVNTPLDEVSAIMIEKDIIRIPVTDKGRLVGVIARHDILREYVQPEYFGHF